MPILHRNSVFPQVTKNQPLRCSSFECLFGCSLLLWLCGGLLSSLAHAWRRLVLAVRRARRFREIVNMIPLFFVFTEFWGSWKNARMCQFSIAYVWQYCSTEFGKDHSTRPDDDWSSSSFTSIPHAIRIHDGNICRTRFPTQDQEISRQFLNIAPLFAYSEDPTKK